MSADEPGQEPTVQVPMEQVVVSPPRPPRRPMARWKKITIVAVAVPVLGLSVMFWVALAEVMSNPAAFRTHTPAPTSTKAAPTTTTRAPPTTTTASSSSARPTTTTATSAAPPVASAQDRAAAVAILTANAQHYRDMFHQGQAIIGHTQYADAFAGLAAMDDPNSAAARFRDYWQNPGPERDLSCDDAFGQADGISRPRPSRKRSWTGAPT
ncbi:hypothetical protein [Kutzneria chonburiensis]|uniref:Uncharacterized protein n=1 Tax=Kutzneria chonburiensis TaxID=1483604 RepID=A0ABV6N0W5_9PSEU|nr:hypothetical protein [Kutzneria chonburiensis]